MKRILTAVVFIPIFILIVGVLSPWVFFLLLAGATILAVREVSQLVVRSGYRFRPILCSILSVLILYAFLDPRIDPIAGVAFSLAVIPFMSLVTGESMERAIPSLGITTLTALSLGVLLGYQILLRGMGDDLGRQLIFFLFLVIWTGDTAAYYVGRALGKHPLLPRVSPNKTIEGCLAGSVGSMAAGAGAAGWFVDGMVPLQGLALGFLLNGFGQVGDLAESVLKRAARVKDSATLLPGHGGILDRVDSLILAGPVFYFCYVYLLH